MLSQPIKLAHAVLRECEIVSPPVNLTLVASRYKIDIIENDLPEDVSGMIHKESGSATIYVKSSDHPRRKRFTIAHELGHNFLNHLPGIHVDKKLNFRTNIMLRSSNTEKAAVRSETQANQFAAELLMPSFMVHEIFPKLSKKSFSDEDLITELADTFKVSEIAMSIRLQNLGLISIQ